MVLLQSRNQPKLKIVFWVWLGELVSAYGLVVSFYISFITRYVVYIT